MMTYVYLNLTKLEFIFLSNSFVLYVLVKWTLLLIQREYDLKEFNLHEFSLFFKGPNSHSFQKSMEASVKN